jgi:nitrogen regulatory protein P-II 1
MVGAGRDDAGMKKIEAIIRPFKLDEVRAALEKVRVHVDDTTIGLAAEVGCGSGVAELIEGTAHVFEGRPVVRIEMVVRNRSVARVRDAIATAACTGRVGDGMLVISSLEESFPSSASHGVTARPSRARRQPAPTMSEEGR